MENNESIKLQKASVLQPDGSTQIVYVPVDKRTELKERLQIAYTVVGTVALLLTAYFTYKQIKKK